MASIETGRGLTVDECMALCNAPRKLPANATRFQIWKHLRDEILVRLLYETWARINELLEVTIPDIDFDHSAIHVTHPKGRGIFKIVDQKRVHIDTVYTQRWVFFSDYTRTLIIRYMDGRKKGHLIVNSRQKKLSTREAERIVNGYARIAGKQKTIGNTKNGRQIQLVTCKALREAGERHTDEAGGDRDATARIAGHTVRTKEAYYKKGNFEEDMKIVRRHHPLMRGKGTLEGTGN